MRLPADGGERNLSLDAVGSVQRVGAGSRKTPTPDDDLRSNRDSTALRHDSEHRAAEGNYPYSYAAHGYQAQSHAAHSEHADSHTEVT
jgi:hypothetical protein